MCVSDEKIISIIIPSLHEDVLYFRCLKSIECAMVALVGKYEIIVVTPFSDKFLYKTIGLIVMKEETSGIYGAMNDGVKRATGRYLYFMGQDDMLLPSFADLVRLITNQDLVLANVFYGSRCVYKNRLSRFFLLHKNWCHQGVLYNRNFFLRFIVEYCFDYKSQADHYANIKAISSAKKILRVDKCIAWYSADGFSSNYQDNDFRNDFSRIIASNFNCFFARYVYVKKYISNFFRFLRGLND